MTDYMHMEAGPEMDAATAELMGWREFPYGAKQKPAVSWFRDDAGNIQLHVSPEDLDRPFSPSTDPAADYEVLVHVRENWDGPALCRFSECLSDVIMLRAIGERGRGRHVNLSGFVAGTLPGDYSRAALLAQEKNDA